MRHGGTQSLAGSLQPVLCGARASSAPLTIECNCRKSRLAITPSCRVVAATQRALLARMAVRTLIRVDVLNCRNGLPCRFRWQVATPDCSI